MTRSSRSHDSMEPAVAVGADADPVVVPTTSGTSNADPATTAFSRHVDARSVAEVDIEDSLLESVELPVLDDLLAVDWVAQAVRDVTYHRQGVVVYGDKGSGRSLALELAAEGFRARERRRRAQRAGYVTREVRVIPPMRPQTRAELVHTLYAAEMGAVPWRLGRSGSDVLLAQLIAGWQDDNVVALLFDETDAFGSGALEGCRDIIALSDALARQRHPGHATPPSTAANGLGAVGAGARGARGARGRGIGVLLLGLPSVYDRLRDRPEWGHRWRKGYPIQGISATILPDVYRRMLPACDRHATLVGAATWAAFVRAHVAPLIRGSVRRVHAHVWEYVALCEQDCVPAPRRLEDVLFDEARFLDAVRGLAGSEAWDRATDERDAGDV